MPSPGSSDNSRRHPRYLWHNTAPFCRSGNVMGFLIDDAWAQGSTGGGETWMTMLPLVLIFVVFYFLLIRPQSKRQKKHREMVSNLAIGDEVVTAGGVLGKVTGVKEQFLSIEVANGVELTVQRHTISAVMPKGTVKAA